MLLSQNLMNFTLNLVKNRLKVLSVIYQATRVKKKFQTRFGQIDIASVHVYGVPISGYFISPYLQERLVFSGQNDVYGSCNTLINKFLRIDINAMQIHRVTNTYGELSVGLVGESDSQTLFSTLQEEEVVYVQADGSMVLTRENKWQEVKVGRIFKQSALTRLSDKRQELSASLYAAHLGSHVDFIQSFEKQIDAFDGLGANLIFLTDGAPWMRLWISENYPKATQILDYTHGVKHIATWLEFAEKDKIVRKQQLSVYKKMLIEQGIAPVIKGIEQTEVTLKTVEEERRKVLNYLNTNAYRMNYPEYIKQNLCIGSGAIEASHRTVVQQRMKRSGQRWTEKRVQNMLNLKVANLSGKWDNIVDLIRNYKKAA
jgi:uncharacterized protein YaiE (UPF0345 family)